MFIITNIRCSLIQDWKASLLNTISIERSLISGIWGFARQLDVIRNTI